MNDANDAQERIRQIIADRLKPYVGQPITPETKQEIEDDLQAALAPDVTIEKAETEGDVQVKISWPWENS